MKNSQLSAIDADQQLLRKMEADNILRLLAYSLRSVVYYGISNLIQFRREFCSIRFLVKFLPSYVRAPRLPLSVNHLDPCVHYVCGRKNSSSSLDDSGLEFDSTSLDYGWLENNSSASTKCKKSIKFRPHTKKMTEFSNKHRISRQLFVLDDAEPSLNNNLLSKSTLNISSTTLLEFDQVKNEEHDSLFQSIADSEPIYSPVHNKRYKRSKLSCHKYPVRNRNCPTYKSKSKKNSDDGKNDTRLKNLQLELDALRGELAHLILLQEGETVFQGTDFKTTNVHHEMPTQSSLNHLAEDKRTENNPNSALCGSSSFTNSNFRSIASESTCLMNSDRVKECEAILSESSVLASQKNYGNNLAKDSICSSTFVNSSAGSTFRKFDPAEFIAKALKAKFCNVRYELDRQESPRNESSPPIMSDNEYFCFPSPPSPRYFMI